MKYVRDWIHERNIDLDGLSNEILNLSKHMQVVFRLDIFRVCCVETGNEAAEGSDTHTFTNTENGYRNSMRKQSNDLETLDIQVSI